MTSRYDVERREYEHGGLILALCKAAWGAQFHSCYNGKCAQLDDLDVMAKGIVHIGMCTGAPNENADATIRLASRRGINIWIFAHQNFQ